MGEKAAAFIERKGMSLKKNRRLKTRNI